MPRTARVRLDGERGQGLGDERASVGIIGGSGLYTMDGLQDVSEVNVDTPFGKPSDAFILGTLEGRKVAFLARHARGHRLLPSELPFRANVWALKSLGVERILSVSAVGSLKEQYEPLHMVIPDQFVDRTFARASTFFGKGLVAHVGFARPFCAPCPQGWPRRAAKRGPRSTRAEPTCAWRARSSPPGPSRTSIARGAWTSSA